MIHPTAIVEPGARLATDVAVGAYSLIGSQVVIEGRTRIGRGKPIWQGASIGAAPQDKKYATEDTGLEIGDGNTIFANYVSAAGNMAQPHGINSMGLRRRGVPGEAIDALQRAYRTIYRSGLGQDEIRRELELQAESCVEVRMVLDFLNASKRGYIR